MLDNVIKQFFDDSEKIDFCILKFKNENILKSENIAIKSPVYYLKNYQPDKESFNKIKRDINKKT